VEHITKDLGAFKIKKLAQSANLTPPRKLVFCEFRKEMDLLEEALAQRNIITGRIDGSTPKNLKEATITSPHIQVLLLQVRTCSEGLNLQQYRDVYIVTPQWNPTIEHQAIARTYRIGQTSSQVNVYRFVMEHDQLGLDQNIETKVIKTQEIKKEESKLLMVK
jgi:SNF2 family DNA or RNA helicase